MKVGSSSFYDTTDILENSDGFIQPEDIELIKAIGSGSFGTVYLVQSMKSKQYYALKVINKDKIKIHSIKKYVNNEKNILQMIKHKFVVQLIHSYESKSHLFLFLEYCQGMDLSKYLDEEGCFTENKARFYACECIAAIHWLHQKGIVYRDLKPNNIMIDSKGHIKLIDFNLSKSGLEKVNKRTNSFCGSYAYMPPEIINRRPYDKNVDW